MKAINMNDEVSVILTKTGSDILSQRNKECNTYALTTTEYRLKTDYKDGDEYRDTLWKIFQIFGKECYAGNERPFNDLTLVQSR